MRRRRTPRPGVTAAATTAVLATGARPGVTALATTAVFATGWPMTPTRPTRAALSGMSGSFGLERAIGLERGDDRLDGDSAVRDQLATRTSCRRAEWCRQGVLPDEHARGAPGVHRRREVRDVVSGQQLGQLGLDLLQVAELLDVGELHRLDLAVLVLDEDEDVDETDGLGLDQRDELLGHLAREVAHTRRELDDEVVDGAQLVEGCGGGGNRGGSH